MKTETQTKPVNWLQEAFAAKKQKNTSYSLRAFARDLEMSQTLLSLVMNGVRPLTLKQAHKISALLQLSPSEERRFLESTHSSLPGNARIAQKVRQAKDRKESLWKVKSMDVEKFHLIARWYHLAILNLVTTKGFKSDSRWIASRLGISKPEAENAIERLLTLGLLEDRNGTLKRESIHSAWTTTNSVAAVRTYHHQMMEKAQEELKKTDEASFEKRSITGTSIALDSKRVSEAHEFIHEFEQEFVRRFGGDDADEVYQINLQFFPVTQSK